MVWPLDENLRPYIRMASYWLHQGRTPEEIMQWASSSRHMYNLEFMQAAIPEAARANYFAARARSGDPNMRLSQLWGLSARAAWYAGYGRAPTAEERQWAYSRPQEMLGLMFEVHGRGARTGRFQHYTVVLNASWGTSLADAIQRVEDSIISGDIITGDLGSEPLQAGGLTVSLIGGALLERHIRGAGAGEVL
jgi:hypothetical protein